MHLLRALFLRFQSVPKRLRKLRDHAVSHVVLSQRMSCLEVLLTMFGLREHAGAIVGRRRSELDFFCVQRLMDFHLQIVLQLREDLQSNPFQLRPTQWIPI